ncbi:MAG: chloride channel protein [Deltaproteobacteria bacterium]|nr:MAG: chloride channel protein [Deltaproteobacteria bacterium]
MSRTKIVFYCILVGLIAGGGAIFFHFLCQLFHYLFLGKLAGYYPPHPAGESPLFPVEPTSPNRLILLILPALGGVVSGWLVYKYAPEAEGHGTDAVIEAYHRKQGHIRSRIPFIKTIASAFTLGSGGSGGREGPIAQIGAGFGSFLGRALKLSEKERRILLAAGMGAGIGSIFRAPLAGALFAAEVLYRELEFEAEVIIPAGISSVVGYCLFCLVYGWGSLFEAPDIYFKDPLELFPYSIMAFVLAGMAVLYVRSFYGLQARFRRLRIPDHWKPAIGGLATGVIGFFLPQTLAFGYGFIQQTLDGKVVLWLLVAVAFGKIFTTSFSIGSGGSGGVFGPSMVIGASIGGAMGEIFHRLFPTVVEHTSPFVIVGMAGFFAAASKAPISTIIFVSEMTNSYHLLLPSMLVCSLSFLLSRSWTIYHQQVPAKHDSPAHRGEFVVDVLEDLRVIDAYTPMSLTKIPENMSLRDLIKVVSDTDCYNYPVVDEGGRLIGMISVDDIRGVLLEEGVYPLIIAKDLAQPNPVTVTLNESLNSALHKFTLMDMQGRPVEEIPVVDDKNPNEIIGVLTRRNLLAAYSREMEKRSRP